jgi:hypothetical protein
MARKPPPELRELAKQRLQRLGEPSPEELEKEVEEARKAGLQGPRLGPRALLDPRLLAHP